MISDKISIQMTKMKSTANWKIKEKTNNRLIQKTGTKQYRSKIVNSK